MASNATHAEIFWTNDDHGYIAIDRTRPGCSAFGTTEEEAFRELQDARIAWDGAKRNAAAPTATQEKER